MSPLLQICLASLSPLSSGELFHTLNARSVGAGVAWEEFVERVEVLTSSHFLVRRQDGGVVFLHPSMREWLVRRDEGDSTKFLCDSK